MDKQALKREEETILMLAEIWRRRVEHLWKMCEYVPSLELDLEWLDKEIEEDEAREERNAQRRAERLAAEAKRLERRNAGKAPKG